MSRASWYRHGKPEQKPQRETQAMLAKRIGVGVRTVQRAARVQREAPELLQDVVEDRLKLGRAEAIIRRVVIGDGFVMLTDDR